MNKEILEGNKLIMEFMGWEKCEDDTTYKFPNLYPIHNIDDKENTGWISEQISNAEFHTRLDWLMPVLEKIEAKGYRWEIGMSPISSQHHYCKIWSIGTIERVSLLDAVYDAVLEFIKWYNLNK